MAARLMIIGLDAVSVDLIDRWSSSGDLPNLARLTERAEVLPLASRVELLPESVWREVITGRSIASSGHYFPAAMLRAGETVPRPLEQSEVDPTTFWTVASDAGCRVAVVDMPASVPASGLNGLQIVEWGAHDRRFGTQSEPSTLIDDLLRRYGEHPIQVCDDVHRSTREGYERFLDLLLQGGEKRAELLLDVLGRDDWDLFACAIAEAHCAGHQLWHFLGSEGRPDLEAPIHLREALRTVYQQVDATVGALLEAAGREATVLVLAAKGMGPACGGLQLLPEVLARLGVGPSPHGGVGSASGLPPWSKAVARRVVPQRARARLRVFIEGKPDVFGSEPARAASLPNEFNFGAIRLNLKGREPRGSVEPGAEAEALIDELRHELLELEDPESGQRIISCAVTTVQLLGSDPHPDLPDLLVAFRADLGVIEACRSARVGVVRVPLSSTWFWHGGRRRIGDHEPGARLWAAGPGARSPVDAPGADVLDIAPTTLALLGIPLPSWLAGRPLPLTDSRPR